MITYRLAKKEDLDEIFQVAAEAFFDYDFFGSYENSKFSLLFSLKV